MISHSPLRTDKHMKDIYLDSTHIHSNTDNSLGMIVKPGIDGLEQPEIRLPSFNRPNVNGAVVPNQLYGGRIISFAGKVFADEISTYRTLRRTLESAVAIKRDENNNLLPITMKFTTMDDLALQIEVYTRKFNFPDLYLRHGDYKLDLLAPSVYILGQESKSAIIYPFDGGGMPIAMPIPMAMNANASASSILVNAGNIDANPTIIVNGAITDPTIVNESNGQTMNFDYTLTSGQYIEINVVDKTVLYYSALGATPVNIRDAVTGDFITLAPGNNVIKLTLGGFVTTGTLQFNWRDSYSGI